MNAALFARAHTGAVTPSFTQRRRAGSQVLLAFRVWGEVHGGARWERIGVWRTVRRDGGGRVFTFGLSLFALLLKNPEPAAHR